jgi:hypothetical protein
LAEFLFLIAKLGSALDEPVSEDINVPMKEHLFKELVKEVVEAKYAPPPLNKTPCTVEVKWTVKKGDWVPALEQYKHVYLIGHGTPGSSIVNPGAHVGSGLQENAETSSFHFDNGPSQNLFAEVQSYDSGNRSQWEAANKQWQKAHSAGAAANTVGSDPYGPAAPVPPEPLLGRASCTVYACYAGQLNFKDILGSLIDVKPFTQTKRKELYIGVLSEAAKDLLARLGAACCEKKITWK